MVQALKKIKEDQLAILSIEVNDTQIVAKVNDGRLVSVPLSTFPRLMTASPSQRRNFKISPGGYGVHWPDLDEDISIKAFFNI